MFGALTTKSGLYTTLSASEDDSLEPLDIENLEKTSVPSKTPKLLNVFFWCSILSSLISIIIWGAAVDRAITDAECIKKMNTYSPALESVQYSWVDYGDYFYPDGPGSHSIYRGSPTRELEDAWRNFSRNTVIKIPHARVKSLAQPVPSNVLQLEPQSAADEGGVAAIVSGFYQMNCLNLIRQYTYLSDPEYSHFYTNDLLLHSSTSSSLLRDRIDHCIETIRQRLICTADITPFLVWNNPRRPTGNGPDFDSPHRCRNWDNLVEWADGNSVTGVADPTKLRVDLW